MWKDMTMPNIKTLCCHMPDESKENHGRSRKFCQSPGQYCNSGPPEREEGLLTTQPQGTVTDMSSLEVWNFN